MVQLLREWYATSASNLAPTFLPPALQCRTSFQECIEVAAHDAHDHDVFIWKWNRSSRRWKCVMYMTRKVERFLAD